MPNSGEDDVADDDNDEKDRSAGKIKMQNESAPQSHRRKGAGKRAIGHPIQKRPVRISIAAGPIPKPAKGIVVAQKRDLHITQKSNSTAKIDLSQLEI